MIDLSLLLLPEADPPLPPGRQLIQIYVGRTVSHEGGQPADPIKPRAWTRQIDAALKPRKPAKGVPRPFPDELADEQEPAGWTYTFLL